MSFFTLILIILSLYIFFRLFTGYILPWLVRLFIKRVQRKFFEQNPHVDPNERQRKGKVTIHRMPDKEGNDIPSDLGEYIDYEELNNNQKPSNE
jgi:hypothetical protein